MNRHRIAVRSAPRFSIVHVLLALALLSAASLALAEEKSLNKTFTVAPGGVLTVEADGADISVTGSDANSVVVRIQARGSSKDLDEMSRASGTGSSGAPGASKRTST
jgi:hypothetical protein